MSVEAHGDGSWCFLLETFKKNSLKVSFLERDIRDQGVIF